MSVLFGLYQPEEGEIRINGKTVNINNPNDANDLESEWYTSTSSWYTTSQFWKVLFWDVRQQRWVCSKMDAARKKSNGAQ